MFAFFCCFYAAMPRLRTESYCAISAQVEKSSAAHFSSSCLRCVTVWCSTERYVALQNMMPEIRLKTDYLND